MWFLGKDSIGEKLSGRSQGIRKIREKIETISLTDFTLLITGETGVGKTVAARLIHKASRRWRKSFLHLNCSNFSPELFESELFGHERGAFTGASERKMGKLEVADGGTVFLDEIGDLSPSNQAKLLVFMENGTFFRVGGTEELRAYVRVIAATNKNLAEEMHYKRFRQDLFYRVSVLKIYIPPLRKRREDIPILAEEILRRASSKVDVHKVLLPDALNKLLEYDYPGNIRELENILKKAMVLSKDNEITRDHIIFDNIFSIKINIANDNEHGIDVLQRKYQEMVIEGKSFWEVIHKPFLRRELNRDEVRKIIQMGLKDCQTYKRLMELFNAGRTQKDYKRFMKVLECHRLRQ